MATNGVIKGTQQKTLWTSFEWRVTSTNVANNTSTISWTLKLHSSSSLVFSADKSFTLKINGTNYGGTFTQNLNWGASGGSIAIKNGTTTIQHEPNGKKSFSVASNFNVVANINGTQVNSLVLSGSGNLNTIPRATTPILETNDVRMGDSITITLNRASSTFKHDLSYSFGTANGSIAKDVSTSTTWTIPRDLANQIPNSTFGTCFITCQTFDGTTVIGTTKIQFTLNIHDRDVPTIEDVVCVDTRTNIANKFNAFVQNRSQIKATVSAKGVYGSKITSYTLKVNGIVHSSKEVTFDAISSGNVQISVNVMDSRGRVGAKTKTIVVEPYNVPTIERFDVVRSNSNGMENPQATHLKASMKFDVTPLNNLNDKSYILEYKEQSATTWTRLTSGNVYSFDNNYIHASPILDDTKAYSIRLTVSDYFSTSTYIADIGTAFVLLNFHSSGKGMAIGKVAELSNGLEINMPLKIYDTSMIDGLVETDWQFLTLDSKFKPYTDNQINTPRWRRRGKVIDIRGVISPTTDMTSNYTQVKFAEGLPNEARPTETIYQLCVGSTKETWTLTIKNDGTLNISQYGIGAYGTIQANARLIFQITYTID